MQYRIKCWHFPSGVRLQLPATSSVLRVFIITTQVQVFQLTSNPTFRTFPPTFIVRDFGSISLTIHVLSSERDRCSTSSVSPCFGKEKCLSCFRSRTTCTPPNSRCTPHCWEDNTGTSDTSTATTQDWGPGRPPRLLLLIWITAICNFLCTCGGISAARVSVRPEISERCLLYVEASIKL